MKLWRTPTRAETKHGSLHVSMQCILQRKLALQKFVQPDLTKHFVGAIESTDLKEATKLLQPAWMNTLIVGDLTDDQRQKLITALLPFASMLDGKSLGATDILECDIPVGQTKPVHARPYAYSHNERLQIKKEVDKYCKPALLNRHHRLGVCLLCW